MSIRLASSALALALLAAPLTAWAQQAGKMYRVAYLGGTPFTPQTRSGWDAFLQGLRERGWIEGQNIVVETRFTSGRPERYPELVAEVLKVPVDVIVVTDSQAAWAAKRATDTTPIVLANVADAAGQGLVASLARPGGNLTGLSNQLEETTEKLLQTLKEIVPRLARIGVVHNPNNPASHVRNEEAAAARLGIKVVPVMFRTPDDLAPAFATIARERVDALLLHIASPIAEHWAQFIEFSHNRQLPTAAAVRRFVVLGGLTYYGPNFADLWYRAAYYVDKILKGAKPADLPVEQPTKFEFVINLKTAKTLGLTIPRSVLARADEVIE
jgi:putative ABC transport system substrate-binding protein